VTSAHCFCSHRKATRLALECLKRRYLGVGHCARKPHSPATARTSHVLAVLTHSISPADKPTCRPVGTELPRPGTACKTWPISGKARFEHRGRNTRRGSLSARHNSLISSQHQPQARHRMSGLNRERSFLNAPKTLERSRALMDRTSFGTRGSQVQQLFVL
jgi:hypothetical protein